jgi:hypothetical protein
MGIIQRPVGHDVGGMLTLAYPPVRIRIRLLFERCDPRRRFALGLWQDF